MSDALAARTVLRVDAHDASIAADVLAVETPVALLFNGVPFAVMLCSPTDLEDFALGFALSEGIVADAAELDLVERLERDGGIVLHLAIPAARFAELQQRQRNLPGRSGCGLCGAEALEQAIRPVRSVSAPAALEATRLHRALDRLGSLQPLNRACGSLHAAAALCGDELLVREDIGRHNALDKVIGAGLRRGLAIEALLVTSRASYELVHKAAEAGVGVLAAVSGATSLAAAVAERAGVCLVGYARAGRFTLYSHASRLILPPGPGSA